MDLFGPGDVNAYSRPLDVAFAHLAVAETPGLSNRGQMVDLYLRFVGLRADSPQAPPGGYEWCCAAVVYWAHKGGVLWLPKVAGVRRLWDLTSDKHSMTPRVGDAFIHFKPGRKKGHIGLVAAFDKKAVYTVEGNSNEHGSRTGNAVVRQTRSRTSGYIAGYIRLDKERFIVA